MFLGGDAIWNILSFIILILFFILFPRIMLYQVLSLLNAKVLEYENYLNSSKKELLKKIRKKSRLNKKQLNEKLDSILNFFVISPSSIDPFGIAKKINFITDCYDKKYIYFSKQLGNFSEGEAKDLAAGLIHTSGLLQIIKLLKHVIQIIKDTKNFQIGLLIQMQLPSLDKQVKALYNSIPAFLNSIPVGDCIAPLIGAKLIGNSKTIEIAEDVVCCKKRIKGRTCFIIKAKGPEANLGKINEAIRKLVKKNRIERVITIDASGKLESEKTGEVCLGVGFAMGDRGAERHLIEDFLIEKGIPMDAIAIKMKPEEALMPMREEILKAIPKVEKYLEELIETTSKNANILIACVGVTIGVGNDKKSFEEAINKIKKELRKEKLKEKKKEKKYRWI